MYRRGHFKAVIHKPQNVFVMRDIACSAYVAGMNTQFFGFEKNQTIAKRYTSSRAKNQIMRRLSFADEVGSKYQSCMSFPVSAAEYEEGSMDTVISVTSRVLPWEVNPSQHHENFPGGEDMYKQYQQILQLGQIHYGEDTRAAENMDFISQVSAALICDLSFCETACRSTDRDACRIARAPRTTRCASWAPTASFRTSRARTSS